MFRSNPIIDRFIQFFLLPNCYFGMLRNNECKKSSSAVAFDLLELFFSYKTFPNHYGPCRLWEVEKSNWKFYYGSNYQSHQSARLLRKVQPLEYRLLFDDKSVCACLCSKAGICIPDIYGIIRPESDYKKQLISYFHNTGTRSLIIKPVKGSGGRDIVLAIQNNSNIFIRSKKSDIPLREFDLAEKSIVQELITQDKRISAFSSSSVNTIRIVTMLTKNETIIVIGATMRFGISESYVDNWSAGGVAVGIDVKTGTLKKYAYDKQGKRYVAHPTSKVVFENYLIPEWQNILDLAINTQKVFSLYYGMLGMDIALREDAEPVLIEINGSPDLLFQEQTSGPLFQNVEVLRAFGQHDLLVNKHQKDLYSSLAERDPEFNR